MDRYKSFSKEQIAALVVAFCDFLRQVFVELHIGPVERVSTLYSNLSLRGAAGL